MRNTSNDRSKPDVTDAADSNDFSNGIELNIDLLPFWSDTGKIDNTSNKGVGGGERLARRQMEPRQSEGWKTNGSAGTNSVEFSPDKTRCMSMPRLSFRISAPSEKSRFSRSTQNTLGEVTDST